MTLHNATVIVVLNDSTRDDGRIIGTFGHATLEVTSGDEALEAATFIGAPATYSASPNVTFRGTADACEVRSGLDPTAAVRHMLDATGLSEEPLVEPPVEGMRALYWLAAEMDLDHEQATALEAVAKWLGV